MANRNDIYQEVKLALQRIKIANGYNTDVIAVRDGLTYLSPEQVDFNMFPVLFIQDTDEEKAQFDLGNVHTISKLLFIVQGMLYNPSGVSALDRTKLMIDVENAICTDTVLFNGSTGLLIEPASPKIIMTDKGSNGISYSTWDQHFEMTYIYENATSINPISLTSYIGTIVLGDNTLGV